MMSVPSISALTAGISCSAWTMALVKKLMKPSFTPWRFSNTSLYWARRAMTLVMSTSLKVVSWAAVFCDSFRRRAMVWRRRVILTRSSRGWSARGAAGAAGAAAAGAGAAAPMAATASALVMLPLGPVAASVFGSRLFSVTTRWTAGDRWGSSDLIWAEPALAEPPEAG